MRMEKKNFWLIFAASLAMAVACNNKPATVDYTSELLQLNSQLDSALLQKDTAKLRSIYAEGLLVTNPEGRVLNRDEQILNVATTELSWQAVESRNVKLNFYGNTAVLNGEFEATASYRGTPLNLRERYTSTWVKTNDGWKLVAQQSNNLR